MFCYRFFGKIFYKFLSQTLVKLKIFYNFDYILRVNKHLKIEKYFTENILLQNKRSVKLTTQEPDLRLSLVFCFGISVATFLFFFNVF